MRASFDFPNQATELTEKTSPSHLSTHLFARNPHVNCHEKNLNEIENSVATIWTVSTLQVRCFVANNIRRHGFLINDIQASKQGMLNEQLPSSSNVAHWFRMHTLDLYMRRLNQNQIKFTRTISDLIGYSHCLRWCTFANLKRCSIPLRRQTHLQCNPAEFHAASIEWLWFLSY